MLQCLAVVVIGEGSIVAAGAVVKKSYKNMKLLLKIFISGVLISWVFVFKVNWQEWRDVLAHTNLWLLSLAFLLASTIVLFGYYGIRATSAAAFSLIDLTMMIMVGLAGWMRFLSRRSISFDLNPVQKGLN